MVLTIKEKIDSEIEGTIIDLETIGYFNERYSDSRRYKGVVPVIFGFINNRSLEIHCARSHKAIEELKGKLPCILDSLERPFYSFNIHFEMGVLFNTLGKEIVFDRELNVEKFEPKWRAVQALKISNYDDPFKDNGLLCMQAWERGDFEKSMAHNRADLLKERDILLKRGFRNPDKLKFITD